MSKQSTTLMLIVSIILLAMWKSGRLARVINIAFGKSS